MLRNKSVFIAHQPLSAFKKFSLLNGLTGFVLVILFFIHSPLHAGLTLLSGTETLNTPQQGRVVKGTVQDANGEGLIGVNIMIKGTTKGNISDADGNYSIEIPSGMEEPVILVFSYVGYESMEVEVGNQTTINVTMQVETMGMDEVVVIGYGSQKRTNLTASISSVTADELAELPIQRADQALQGRTSGVYVLNTDGSPGGETIIRIRGINSINGGNEPLVVIDGLQGGDLTSLNPQDIASMEILKDASATAIYGSRGANGVILITTKLGRSGKPVIDANFSYGIQNLARKMPVMSAADYARTVNAYRMTNTADGNIPEPVFTDQEISQFERDGGTDWQDEMFDNGQMSNIQMGVSGGSDALRYLVSANYLDHKGILKNSEYNRISLRANLAADIAKWVDFGLNYAFTKETYKSPEFREFSVIPFVSQTLNTTVRWAPTEPVYDPDGNYHRHSPLHGPYDTWNPMASAVEPDLNRPAYRNNANIFLNIKPLKGLSLRISGGALITQKLQNDYYNTETMNGFEHNGEYFGANSMYERYQNNFNLTYESSGFANHQLTATGVFEQIYDSGEGTTLEGRGFLVDQLSYHNLEGASVLFPASSATERSLLSYLGRVNYSYANKYLLTATYRADASSVFGEDNKWGYFPSASAAWRIAEEEFLNDVSAIQELKLRASWGKTGNQGISPYQSLARLSSGQGDYGPNYPYDGLSNTNTGFQISGLANPDLKWETTTQTNIGLDLVALRGRLKATIDVYKKLTEDLLMPRELPGYVGVGSVLSNVGSVENKGLEIQVGGDPVGGSIQWYTSVNFTMNRNKVLDLGDDDIITYYTTPGGYSVGEFMVLQVGQPFGSMRGWEYLGVWKSDQDEEARSYGQLPGDPRYRDVDEDGDVDEDDRVVIGQGYPDFTWGWTNRLNYRNFELSVLFIGMQGADLFNQLRIRRDGPNEGNSPVLLDRWTPDNQDTDVPGFIDGAYRQEQALQNQVFIGEETSRWVEDASFIKLKMVRLSYTLPKSVLNKIGVNNMKLFVTGTNLVTITDYTGFDPEVANFTQDDAMIGVDYAAYPPARTYTFGIEVNF